MCEGKYSLQLKSTRYLCTKHSVHISAIDSCCCSSVDCCRHPLSVRHRQLIPPLATLEQLIASNSVLASDCGCILQMTPNLSWGLKVKDIKCMNLADFSHLYRAPRVATGQVTIQSWTGSNNSMQIRLAIYFLQLQ